MHPPVAEPDLPDLLLKSGLAGPTGRVPIGLWIEPDRRTGAEDRDRPVGTHPVDERSLPTRPQSFRLMTSWSISRSSVRSATIFVSRAFSCSSSCSRLISDGSTPAYYFLQLKYVAWLIPAFRQISETGIPSSPCLMMNAFCASVNCDAFNALRSFSSQGDQRGKLYLTTRVFQGSRPASEPLLTGPDGRISSRCTLRSCTGGVDH